MRNLLTTFMILISMFLFGQDSNKKSEGTIILENPIVFTIDSETKEVLYIEEIEYIITYDIHSQKVIYSEYDDEYIITQKIYRIVFQTMSDEIHYLTITRNGKNYVFAINREIDQDGNILLISSDDGFTRIYTGKLLFNSLN